MCEDLGLDPIVYRITCIPFDVYTRLADRYGWGRQRLWTHFDGYQITRELHLQALVGGDAHFGGADDLCGVGRAYDSEHITGSRSCGGIASKLASRERTHDACRSPGPAGRSVTCSEGDP